MFQITCRAAAYEQSLFVDTLLLPVPTTLCSPKEQDMKRAIYELRKKLNYLSRILIHLKGQSRIYTSITTFHSFQTNLLMLSIYLHKR